MRISRVVRRYRLGLVVGVCLLGIAIATWIYGCHKGGAPRVTIRQTTWFVDLAVTEEQYERGLAGRTELSDDAGMLFIFPDSAMRLFCMRGCFIPLDIAFIDEHRKVVLTTTMAVEAEPTGKTLYSSQVPAKYALEVPVGVLGAAGVQVGDKVIFRGRIPR